MKGLFQTLFMILVVAAFTVLPSVVVVQLVYRIFAKRNRPLIWYPAFLLALGWCTVAVLAAKWLLSFRVAPQPAVGADPFIAIVALALVSVAVGTWFVFLAPSFVALVTLLVVHPALPGLSHKIRLGAQRFWAHPRRNYMLAAAGIAVAAVLRAALWWFSGF